MEGMSGAALFASTHSKEEATMTLRLALQVAEEAHQDGMLNLEEYQSTVEELQTTYHKQLEGVGTKLADVQGASGEREARLLDNDEQSVQSQGLSGFDEIYKASNTERLHNARVAPDQHSEGSASSENGPPASSSPPKLSLSLATLPVQEQPDEVHASLPAENDIAPVFVNFTVRTGNINPARSHLFDGTLCRQELNEIFFKGCSAEACPGLESCLAENEGDGACSRDDLSSADCDCIAPSTELCEAILGKLLLLL
eukprot:gene13120-15492_t